jgi:hypothetical protein
MMHLSRFCEELILWSCPQFGYIEIGDAFTTGSSIMPQKKNPDVAELVRGKTGRVYGSLNSLLTLLKGLPFTYNRDLQEDKEPVFDASDTVQLCLQVFAAMLPSIKLPAIASGGGDRGLHGGHGFGRLPGHQGGALPFGARGHWPDCPLLCSKCTHPACELALGGIPEVTTSLSGRTCLRS